MPICINCKKSITMDEWKRSYPFCRNCKEKNNIQKKEKLEIESSKEQNAKECHSSETITVKKHDNEISTKKCPKCLGRGGLTYPCDRCGKRISI